MTAECWHLMSPSTCQRPESSHLRGLTSPLVFHGLGPSLRTTCPEEGAQATERPRRCEAASQGCGVEGQATLLTLPGWQSVSPCGQGLAGGGSLLLWPGESPTFMDVAVAGGSRRGPMRLFRY